MASGKKLSVEEGRAPGSKPAPCSNFSEKDQAQTKKRVSDTDRKSLMRVQGQSGIRSGGNFVSRAILNRKDNPVEIKRTPDLRVSRDRGRQRRKGGERKPPQ